MSTITLDHLTSPLMRNLLYNRSVIAEERAGFYECYGFGKAVACCFDYAYGIWVGEGFGADVVCFVEIAVVAVVVEGYVYV